MAIKLDAFIDQQFAGITPAVPPRFVFVIGPIASGKTRHRRTYAPGEFVQLDAGDLFNALGGHEDMDFPGELEAIMNDAGRRIAERAIAGRYSLMIEASGDQRAALMPIIERMKALGYRVEMEAVTVDLDKSIEYNEARGPDNISSYFAQDYHLAWLADAAQKACA